ncbi:MAG: hypothetical protein LBC28_00180 [Oscillospiraceae bacterium]|jgi:hypothetical protein|nr:hypothetical protein [Oscillospiraceae bacterium]
MRERRLIEAGVALLAAAVVYLSAAPYDYIDVTYYAEDMRIAEEAPYSSRVYGAGELLAGGYGGAGAIAETPAEDFPPGRHTYYISAETAGDDFYIELYSPRYSAGDNTEGRVFASADIPAGNGTTEFRFETSAVIREARLRVGSRGGGDGMRFYAITGKYKIFRDAEVLAVLTAAGVLICAGCISRRRDKLRHFEPGEAAAVVCCVLTAAVSALPIARLSLSYAHDIYFHLTRIEGVYEGLLSGQFPVRINPTFIDGYGYADAVMYPPLFIYFPAALRLLRASPTTSYQLFVFGTGLLTSSVSYKCFKRLFGRRDLGIFASAAYTLCLYRLICILTRAAAGELLAMAFLPLLALGMYEAFFGDSRRGARCLVIGFTGLLCSHIISVVIALIACLIFFAVNLRRLKDVRRLTALVSAAVATVLINAWIIVPMLQTAATGLNALYAQRDISEHAVYPAEMFATFVSAFGLSGDVYEPRTEMPLSVGGILGLGALAFVTALAYRRFGNAPRGDIEEDARADARRAEKLGAGGLFLALCSLYLASTLFPWSVVANIPVLGSALAIVQFPWRYFGIASVGLVIVLTSAVALLAPEGGQRRLIALTLCTLGVFLASSPYIDGYSQDPNRTPVLTRKYSHLATYAIGGQEYLRRGSSLDALRARGQTVTASGARITGMSRAFTSITFSYDSAEEGAYAELPLYYYDGYAARDGSDAKLSVTEGVNGVVRVALPRGSGEASVGYSEPLSYRAAELVSLAAIVAAAIMAMRRRRRPRRTLNYIECG